MPNISEAYHRHANHYLNVLRDLDNRFKQGGELERASLDLLQIEWENISQGQDWAQNHIAHGEDIARLTSNLATAGVYLFEIYLHPIEYTQWLKAALNAAQNLGNQLLECNHLLSLGNTYANMGMPQKAIACYLDTLSLSQELEFDAVMKVAYGNLGDAYIELGEMEQALFYLKESQQFLGLEDGKRFDENILASFGVYYATIGDPHQALTYYKQAFMLATEINNVHGKGAILGNIGLAYADLGDFENAKSSLEQALITAKQMGDKRFEGQILGNIGVVFSDTGNYEEALSCHFQALQISREINDRRAEGQDLGNIGTTYRYLGENRTAIEYHLRALMISREIGNQREEGRDLNNIGNACYDLGKTNLALVFYKASLRLLLATKDLRGVAYTSWSLGLIYAENNDFERAIPLLQNCVDYEHKIKHPQAEEDALFLDELKASLSG